MLCLINKIFPNIKNTTYIQALHRTNLGVTAGDAKQLENVNPANVLSEQLYSETKRECFHVKLDAEKNTAEEVM